MITDLFTNIGIGQNQNSSEIFNDIGITKNQEDVFSSIGSSAGRSNIEHTVVPLGNKMEEGNKMFSLNEDKTTLAKPTSGKDILKGLGEFGLNVGSGLVTYIPSMAGKYANTLARKSQALAMQGMSEEEKNQYLKDMKEVGNDVIIDPELIKQEGDKIAGQIGSMGGLIQEPESKFGKQTVGLVNKGFEKIHSGIGSGVKLAVDEKKHPNLFNALVDGIEFAALSAMHPIMKKGKIKLKEAGKILDKVNDAKGWKKVRAEKRANKIIDDVANMYEEELKTTPVQEELNTIKKQKQEGVSDPSKQNRELLEKQKAEEIKGWTEKQRKLQKLLDDNVKIKDGVTKNIKENVKNPIKKTDEITTSETVLQKNKETKKLSEQQKNLDNLFNQMKEKNKKNFGKENKLTNEMLSDPSKLRRETLAKDYALIQKDAVNMQRSIQGNLEKLRKKINFKKEENKIEQQNIKELERSSFINQKYLEHLESLKKKGQNYTISETGVKVPFYDSHIQVLKDKVNVLSKVLNEKKTLFENLMKPLQNQTGAVELHFKSKQVKALEKLKKEAEKQNKAVPDFLISNGMSYEKAWKIQDLVNEHLIETKTGTNKKIEPKKTVEVLQDGINQIWANPNYGPFFNYLKEEKRMINPYSNNGVAPNYVRPLIGKEYPKIKEGYKDRQWYHEGQSPHNQFDYAYDLENNPSYDMMESYMTYHQNVANQLKWSKDIVEKIGDEKSTSDLNEALKPIQEKLDSKIKATFESQERVTLRENKINKMRTGKQKDKLELLNKKEKKRIKGSLIDINKRMQDHLDKVMPKLAKDHADIRIMLDLENHLPEGIKLSGDELQIRDEIKKFLEDTKQELIRNDIPVLEGNYLPNIWNAAIGKENSIKKIFGSQERKLPTMLKFQHKMKNSRNWYPDMKTILDTYIPVVNKKLSYQPFLDRWREATIDMPPSLKDYFNTWVNKNMTTEKPTKLGKIGNSALAFEYFRTIGFSLKVAFAHMLKSPHTMIEVGPVNALKTLPKAIKIGVDTAFNKLGWEKTPTNEARLMGSFYNMKSIIENLEGAGLENASHMAKVLPGSLTTLVEFLENGVNVLATAEAGTKKGVSPKIIQKRIWESILDANFRMGPDEYVWRKNSTGARMVSLYLNTPAKMLEHHGKILRKAFSKDKDNFGTSYGKKLMYMIALIGITESIARSQDSTVLHALLHIPHPHSLVDTGKELGEAITHPNDLEVKRSLQKTFPQLNKINESLHGRYNTKYYNSTIQSLLGIKRNKIYSNASKRKLRKGRVSKDRTGRPMIR